MCIAREKKRGRESLHEGGDGGIGLFSAGRATDYKQRQVEDFDVYL